MVWKIRSYSGPQGEDIGCPECTPQITLVWTFSGFFCSRLLGRQTSVPLPPWQNFLLTTANRGWSTAEHQMGRGCNLFFFFFLLQNMNSCLVAFAKLARQGSPLCTARENGAHPWLQWAWVRTWQHQKKKWSFRAVQAWWRRLLIYLLFMKISVWSCVTKTGESLLAWFFFSSSWRKAGRGQSRWPTRCGGQPAAERLCWWRALCLHDRGFMLREKNVTRDRVRFGFSCFNCRRI